MLHYYDTFPPPENYTKKVEKRLAEEPNLDESCTIIDSKLGKYVELGKYTSLRESEFDDYSYAGEKVSIVWSSIGKFCAIANGVRINPGNHPTWRVTQHHSTYRRVRYDLDLKDDADFFDWRKSHWCSVGHDTWIGTRSIIMAGVKIGIGAVIGAGSVITKDVGNYEVVAGRPARLIKKRFSQETINGIMSTSWWNWSSEKLKESISDLMDINKFLEKHG